MKGQAAGSGAGTKHTITAAQPVMVRLISVKPASLSPVRWASPFHSACSSAAASTATDTAPLPVGSDRPPDMTTLPGFGINFRVNITPWK